MKDWIILVEDKPNKISFAKSATENKWALIEGDNVSPGADKKKVFTKWQTKMMNLHLFN